MINQKTNPKIQQQQKILNVVIFSPLVILTLTHFLPNNSILGLLSMLVICAFPGYAILNRFKLHRSSRFQDLFFSVLLSLLLLQAIYATYSVFCFGIGFEHSLTKEPVFIIASILSFLNLILIGTLFKDTLANRIEKTVSFKTGIKNLIRAFTDEKFKTIFTTIFLVSTGFSFFTQFFQVDQYNQ
jgi:uncharacterized membrane protein